MSQILKSLHGSQIGLDKDGLLVVPAGYKAGTHGKQIDFPSPSKVAIFDDFLGGTLAYGTTLVEPWRSRVGTTNAVAFTRTGAVGGTAVGTIGDTTASMAVSGVQIDSGLNWKANQGALAFEARIKLSAITNIAVYLGFTDQVGALEMPIHSAASANTITTNASDGVGFFFDTSMSDDNWWVAGVAANTDATHEDLATAPTANAYETFRIELDTSGAAVFYRNGNLIGSKMSGAVTATVALTPVVAGFNRTTSGTPTITLDYLHVSGNRG